MAEKTHKIRLGTHGWTWNRPGLGIGVDWPPLQSGESLEDRPVIEVPDELYQDIKQLQARGSFDFTDVKGDEPATYSIPDMVAAVRAELDKRGVKPSVPVFRGKAGDTALINAMNARAKELAGEAATGQPVEPITPATGGGSK